MLDNQARHDGQSFTKPATWSNPLKSDEVITGRAAG
jgi:hypothetical protein